VIMFRVIIAGCRDYYNYNIVSAYCDRMLKNKVAEGEQIVIVSGHCRGIDQLGERYAYERGYQVVLYPVYQEDWNKYGRSAGQMRNAVMADNADALIAFWDNKSAGTGGMIKIAQNKGLEVRVKYINRR